tara:strand:- start:541 stop:753 length:213 start_codon:yes stop_codon:yes gene_type:complete
MNHQEMTDCFLAGMIRALESIQEVRAEGDDLNTVQWQKVIEMRRRDMFDVSKLDEFTASAYSQKSLEENI